MSASLSFVVSDASLVSSVCSPFPFPLFIYIFIYKVRESGLTWVFYYYFFCNYYYYYHYCWKVELEEKKKGFNILKLLFWIFCESMGAVDSQKKNQPTTTKKLCDRQNKNKQKVVFWFWFLFWFCFFLFFYFFLQGWCGIHSGFQKNSDWKRSIQKMCKKKKQRQTRNQPILRIRFYWNHQAPLAGWPELFVSIKETIQTRFSTTGSPSILPQSYLLELKKKKKYQLKMLSSFE